ncbi:acyltransferase [Emticicia sp. 21SJ11W-3]|uniref:acyltransferase family protein n=1 Tax=Emticicia sp. 21SJ11W-3 TaxID=2916755 RepID=UPI00209D0D45|nr:acyltransferase [Emticicia sp. 21SJ11W-3]UTA66688.1 acyltransferase [Emticicia sp. 21SJ11W-3]
MASEKLAYLMPGFDIYANKIYMKLTYFRNLDGLRAVAALGVVVAHFFEDKLNAFPLLKAVSLQGHTGVSWFFVLSGFVITRILLKSVQGAHYFRNFYGRRTLRIFPLYYFALLCYHFLPYLLGINPVFPKFSTHWYFYVYLQNFARTFNWPISWPSHFWSLAVEEHFYLIWPALVYWVISKSKNRLLLLSLALVAGATALRYLMLIDNYEINVFTFTRLDQLSLGCILAILESKGYLNAKARSWFLALTALGAIAVALCSRLDYFYLNVFKHNAYGLLYMGLTGYCIAEQSATVVNRFLNSGLMQYLGKISYGIYVWHRLVMLLHSHYFNPGNMAFDFLLICVLTVMVSSISFYVLESPFLKLKRYFE